MLLRFLLASLPLFAIAGCALNGSPNLATTAVVESSVDSAEYAPFFAEGTATLTGQAFVKTTFGSIRTAAGNPVILDPVTRVSRPWFRSTDVWWKKFEDVPKSALFAAARRRQVADAQGNFRFSDLPAGWYYLRTYVDWSTRRTLITQGGVVIDSVLVVPGKETRFLLQRKLE